MGAELKIIFDNLNKVKKSIEDGFKTGIMLEAKTQSSEFGKNIEKLTGQLDKTLKSQQKLEPQFKMLRKQQQLLSNNTKGLNIKIKENINKANKLITKYGNIQAKGGSDEALEKIELRLEKIKTQTEKFRLTIDKNGLIANQQDEKIKSIVEQANILSEEKMSLDQDLIAATEEIVNSFSYIDKVLYKIYNKMGMEKQKDNLIAKKLSGGASAKG
ncbi:MAG: hypothetical protein EOL97_12845, partial [Spirochaetia bacterium]|nr:hypothetical protein [Spirochaetia bacterium]